MKSDHHRGRQVTCPHEGLWGAESTDLVETIHTAEALRPLPLTPSRPPGFIITAERGQNVSLTCDLPDPDGAGVLEWTRADLKEAYVFRDRTPDPDLQHPSFRNRVSLQDGPMGGPDRSVVLQEVTLDDSGTYEKQNVGELLLKCCGSVLFPPSGLNSCYLLTFYL
uniref:Ig-like domain-containing protein n=1 Tax=Oryzias latipes TaxID=8090 RepID=A0A3P9JTA9_ORYLA